MISSFPLSQGALIVDRKNLENLSGLSQSKKKRRNVRAICRLHKPQMNRCTGCDCLQSSTVYCTCELTARSPQRWLCSCQKSPNNESIMHCLKNKKTTSSLIGQTDFVFPSFQECLATCLRLTTTHLISINNMSVSQCIFRQMEICTAGMAST